MKFILMSTMLRVVSLILLLFWFNSSHFSSFSHSSFSFTVRSEIESKNYRMKKVVDKCTSCYHTPISWFLPISPDLHESSPVLISVFFSSHVRNAKDTSAELHQIEADITELERAVRAVEFEPSKFPQITTFEVRARRKFVEDMQHEVTRLKNTISTAGLSVGREMVVVYGSGDSCCLCVV